MSENDYVGLLAVANGWKARALVAEAERDAAQAKLAAIGKLSPTDYDDREQLLGALFRILRGVDEGGE